MELTRLFDFFQGKASEKDIQNIDNHLSEGGEDAFLEYQRAHYLYEGIMMFDADKSVLVRRRKNTSAIVRWVSIAAIFVAIAVPASLYILKGNQKATLPVSSFMLETRSGQTASLTLPDGSVVRLNSGSTLEYPSFFDGDERRVSLKGEAYFDVAHDQEHPFIVSTYASDVCVHGTSFNVLAREEDSQFTTTLVSGSVSLVNLQDRTDTILMAPSDVVSYENGRLVRQEQGSSSLCWIDGRVDLRCTDFDSLMHRLENVYGVKINVKGTRPSTNRLSGEIATSHGADYALHVLGIALGTQYRLEPDGSYCVICK